MARARKRNAVPPLTVSRPALLVKGSDAEFRRHPLIALLLACGSRGWEDSLT